jgi:tetratricopeptide (TPR) repeat protein
MAPEQIPGSRVEVGPAADGYGLGAVLYECLIGRPPFRAATPLETLDLIRTVDPAPPRQLNARVPADLETVCLKCLHKDPRKRYASALDLAEDLARFLRGEPVQARRAGAWERLWKWARRRPTAAALVVVSVLSALTLVAGGLVSNAQLQRAVKQAQDNEAEAVRQQDIALDRYQNASRTLQRMLARVQGRGKMAAATRRELRQALLEDSLAFYQEILERADDPDPAIRLDVAEACHQTGAIQAALGKTNPGRENLLRAVALVEGLPPQYRDRPAAQDCLADCCTLLGRLPGPGQNLKEAERWLGRALAIQERLSRENPDDPDRQWELARIEHNFADAYLLAGQRKQAEPHLDRAVELRTRLVRDHPRRTNYRSSLAGDYQNLGLLYMNTGRPGRALLAYEKAVGLLRPLLVELKEPFEARSALAAALTNWGLLLCSQGKAQAALRLQDEAVALAEIERQREPAAWGSGLVCLNAYGARAQTNERLGRYAEAARDYGQVAELTEEPRRSLNRLAQAVMLVHSGDHAGATTVAGALAAPAALDDVRYNAACVYALAAGAARRDNRLSSSQREAQGERYAAEAIALLRRLAAAGYFKKAERATLLEKDTDFDPLRARPDFKKLLAEARKEKGK